MSKTKKLIACFIAALMIIAAFPVASLAGQVAYMAHEAKELAKLDDAWKPIEAVEAEMKEKKSTPAEVAAAAYQAALNNPLVDKGSLVWEKDEQFAFTVNGMHCVYYYRARNTVPPQNVDEKLLEVIESGKKGSNCGSAQAVDVLLVGPYYGQDSSFTNQYKNEATSIANATGGTRTMLSGTSATGPAIAQNYTNKGVVIYDSHGTQSGTSSYLCLTTNTGITTTDYNNGWAVSSGSAAFIDGRYIQNHISGTLSNCFVWMAICEGMKKAGKGTTGTALLAAGAGGVYGYSQSVSFDGDYEYEETFWTQMKNGKTVKEAIATMKSTHGNWDPAYSSSSGAAWPIVMSAVDAFPSNPDGTQTVNCDWELFGSSYTVTATSNNTSYGTVSVNGYVITASPKTGYYAAGYTVTSGTATVVQNGNTFTVTPSSDCTVRINFAAKTQNTVTFIASGTTQGTQTAYTGDSITLPSTAAVNPDGWTFIGWLGNTLAETTNKPTYYAPGASYTVNGNATLYALYNRLEGGGGEVVYQLTDHIEDGLNYIIVAQNTISGTTGKAVGNTVVTSSKYLSPVSVTLNNTDNTVTATAANLPKVVWKAAGNATSGFSFYNAAVNKYMALNSGEVLYPATSGIIYWLYESDYELNNQVDSEGYYWLSYSDGNDSVGYARYTTSKSENSNPINLYVETELGTTYYTTDPVVSTPTYTVTFKDWDGTVLKTQEVEQGQAATAPADPTRVGYTFTGWDVAFDNVQSDLVVTAQYTINTYTVTFKDWDGTVLKTQTVNYGGAATAPANPTRVGYTFTGWDVAFNNVTSNLVVTAQYQINTYTVTFVDWNGTVLKTQTVNYGAAATAPADPTRDGYTFTGWDVAFNNVTSNLTVTAQYEQNAPSQYLKGDVNCDGIVDSADITLAAAYAMSAGSVSAQGVANGDMNGDGLLTAADLSALYSYIQG